jgi:hypothetical protein
MPIAVGWLCAWSHAWALEREVLIDVVGLVIDLLEARAQHLPSHRHHGILSSYPNERLFPVDAVFGFLAKCAEHEGLAVSHQQTADSVVLNG